MATIPSSTQAAKRISADRPATLAPGAAACRRPSTSSWGGIARPARERLRMRALSEAPPRPRAGEGVHAKAVDVLALGLYGCRATPPPPTSTSSMLPRRQPTTSAARFGRASPRAAAASIRHVASSSRRPTGHRAPAGPSSDRGRTSARRGSRGRGRGAPSPRPAGSHSPAWTHHGSPSAPTCALLTCTRS